MVTDKDGYIHLIQYLTEHLGLFEASEAGGVAGDTVMELFEEQLAAQIIMVINDHSSWKKFGELELG